MKIAPEHLNFALMAMQTAQQNRQKELDSMPYTEYLQTPEWSSKRARARRRAGNRCERCFIRIDLTRLDTHHIYYRRRGHEQDADLIVLCARCHRKEHNGLKALQDRNTKYYR